MNVILLMGQCGSGKTWVMKQLIKKLKIDSLGKAGMVLYHRNDNVAILGKYDGTTFEGSDRLSMAVMKDIPLAIKTLTGKVNWVIAEGDRFTNKNFIPHAKYVVHIKDDGIKGRAIRGSSQTERQLRSIATRVSNLSTLATHSVEDSNKALSTILKLIK